MTCLPSFLPLCLPSSPSILLPCLRVGRGGGRIERDKLLPLLLLTSCCYCAAYWRVESASPSHRRRPSFLLPNPLQPSVYSSSLYSHRTSMSSQDAAMPLALPAKMESHLQSLILYGLEPFDGTDEKKVAVNSSQPFHCTYCVYHALYSGRWPRYLSLSSSITR